jgi:phosphoglycolate phosphatase
MKVLLFDFDGVLADSLDYFIDHFLAACAEHNHGHINSRETFVDLFDGNFYEAIVAAGVPAQDLPPIIQSMNQRLIDSGRSYTHYPQIPETIATLAKKHTLYIITSNRSQPVKKFIHRHRMDHFADVLGSDHHVSKIAKIEQVKAAHPGAEFFYIGDTKGDMLEGRAAGVKTVAVTWGWHTHEKLAEARPDHCISQPADLLKLFPGT